MLCSTQLCSLSKVCIIHLVKLPQGRQVPHMMHPSRKTSMSS
ncbi:hypothetical protein I3842_08G173000 [Carya illinoinensis]|uniref:Uncharacterized protein n=1 Tax=Carya illinoinensis TaxID=32201 RepID=A0A922JB19_CARIL|nr:hypothetical protein I3842_08G173000 [Carya illinoinensis]